MYVYIYIYIHTHTYRLPRKGGCCGRNPHRAHVFELFELYLLSELFELFELKLKICSSFLTSYLKIIRAFRAQTYKFELFELDLLSAYPAPGKERRFPDECQVQEDTCIYIYIYTHIYIYIYIYICI